jgi:hypothetical protein
MLRIEDLEANASINGILPNGKMHAVDPLPHFVAREVGGQSPAPPPPGGETAAGEQVKVSVPVLNTRSQPDITGRIIGHFSQGDTLTVCDRTTDAAGNHWAKVEVWIAEEFEGMRLVEPV